MYVYVQMYIGNFFSYDITYFKISKNKYLL